MPLYHSGDKVWLSTQDIRLRHPGKKMSLCYIGPFTIRWQINEVIYELQLPHQYCISPTFHVSLLKTFTDSVLPLSTEPEVPPPPESNTDDTISNIWPTGKGIVLKRNLGWIGMTFSTPRYLRNSISTTQTIPLPEAAVILITVAKHLEMPVGEGRRFASFTTLCTMISVCLSLMLFVPAWRKKAMILVQDCGYLCSSIENTSMKKTVGCELEEKERFWSELDEVMESIPTGERVVIGADFNGHVGEGNRGNEEVMGKFGVKERNLEGQMVVDFAKSMDKAVVNTYFQKREEHRVTYNSGGRRTQVDYILCRRGNLEEISDCKVVVGESVIRQHRMMVCSITLMVCKKKRSKIEIEKKTKCWNQKKEECCEEFRQKLRQALGGQVVLPDGWETTAEVIRETGRKVLGVPSGRRKEDKETWWWNEEVQDSVQRKRLAKKKWDMDRTEENRQEYKESQRKVKREVSKAKQKAYDKLCTSLDTREGQKDLYRLARQRDRDGKDVQQVRVIKDRDGRVLTSEESVEEMEGVQS
ncbi:hypothetical protein QTP86_013333 [Hemibagrus guttatus]|nr:hypothetical protein QTP86_013333 [Hemibagrus guttatus]